MVDKQLSDLTTSEYKYGFVTDVQEEKAPVGLTEDTIKWISSKKQEPDWMLAWRLKAFAHFLKLLEKDQIPKWANVKFHPIDFQGISYYAAPKANPKLESLDQVDPEILAIKRVSLKFKLGNIFSTTCFAPGFCRPIAFNMPSYVS